MNKSDKIYVAGGSGLVGSAIIRNLHKNHYSNVFTTNHSALDLTNQNDVYRFFQLEKPDYVFLAAAKVGGIHANNTYAAEFIRDNLLIQTNIIDAAYKNDCKKLVFLGSSCIYPKLAPQPMPESCLLTGPLEPTNQWYAIAKIAGIKTCQAYSQQYGFNAISLMPTNLYGPGDNFHLGNSHVMPALIRKFHEAKSQNLSEVEVWGSGTPRREFLHVDDMADASIYLMNSYDNTEVVNIGVGDDISIKELAEMIKLIVGYEGQLVFDSSKPDGTPRKLMDVAKLKSLGWKASISLTEGIQSTYDWYIENQSSFREV